ncbi:PREDICTED: neurofilament heavy polypeptide-like [Papilio xuthus]|uniref:Neurofilament heavy polypeptide-like n=1 Tax=Papilio xuthus TaxID=66420 RepID=A0AAJ6ZH15_PAPXU|nr:PREDICTED: neurofilament heavy polypeptide-like [Papilio xuthus]
MELLSQVSNVQFLYPVAAVAVVLVCAALVFIFGFHSAEQPQFDKLPLVLDDRKSSNKKRKIKEKKSSPNRTADEVKTKTETAKKSPAKEKKEEKPEKQKEPEKPKPKEKAPEPKPVKKEANDVKKGKKKPLVEAEKPADFDEGVWEEVPKKSDKKKVKGPEEKDKKDSPTKKNKKKAKDADVEAARPADESSEEPTKVIVTIETPLDEESSRALQAQVEEFQRVLKEAERRDQAALGNLEEDDAGDEELPEVKDLRSNKKKENKEKQIKKKAVESAAAKSTPKGDEKDASDSSEKQDDNQNVPVFDELGDTWTDAKVSKKSKKKARKE